VGNVEDPGCVDVDLHARAVSRKTIGWCLCWVEMVSNNIGEEGEKLGCFK